MYIIVEENNELKELKKTLIKTEHKIQEVDNRLQEYDKVMKKKIQLSSDKAKLLREAVKKKVQLICKENKMEYAQVKSKLFSIIYRKIKSQYEVKTYRELPEYFWDTILEDLEKIRINIKNL